MSCSAILQVGRATFPVTSRCSAVLGVHCREVLRSPTDVSVRDAFVDEFHIGIVLPANLHDEKATNRNIRHIRTSRCYGNYVPGMRTCMSAVLQ